MKLKHRRLPLMVGALLIAAAPAGADEIQIQYKPLDGPTVEAAGRYQWHPPMSQPNQLPVSLQVDRPQLGTLAREAEAQPYMYSPGENGLPPVGPSGWED